MRAAYLAFVCKADGVHAPATDLHDGVGQGDEGWPGPLHDVLTQAQLAHVSLTTRQHHPGHCAVAAVVH